MRRTHKSTHEAFQDECEGSIPFIRAIIVVLSIVVAALVTGPAAAAPSTCEADWTLDRPLDPNAPFDRELFRRVPATVVLGQLGDEIYLESLQGGEKARRRALETHDEARRRLLGLEVLLRIWFPERDAAEFLKVFFGGPVGDDAPTMITNLEAIGAERQARALKAGVALFGKRYPASDKRAKAMGSWNTPSKLGLTVQALAPELGTRLEFAEALGRYACATASVRDWLEEARARMSEEDRLHWAAQRLVVAYHFSGGADEVASGLEKLPEPYRVIYLVRLAAAEIINGGVEQFFSNSSGATAVHAVEAFRKIGLNAHADILARGVAMFSQPYETDRTKRYAGEAGWSARDDALSALTDDWDHEAVETAVTAYARREGIVPE